MLFSKDLGDDLTLVLRTDETAEAVHNLVLANLDRLRVWEQWAHGPQTLEGMRGFTSSLLQSFARDTCLPLVIAHRGTPVGTTSLRYARTEGTGEIGYWIDEAAEGYGLVRRAVEALLEEARRLGLRTVVIRTATTNSRSTGLAERLGFTHVRTIAGGLPAGSVRHDAAVYAIEL